MSGVEMTTAAEPKVVDAKVVLLGALGVGKTSIITRYAQKKFSGTTSPTIGASFTTLRVNVDNVRVRLQLWDTAGQERFRAMAPLYYRNANAAIVAYDITSSSSFCALQQWVIELTRNVEGPIVLVLVGNKCDLTEQRAVEKADAQRYARGVGGHFFECSALSNEGIDFKQKIINLDGMPVKLQIWDTAGQERFRTLTTAYYRGAMGILIMYDVTNMDSFNHLSYWFRNIEENASPEVVKVLVGNKCDATHMRQVEKDRGEKIAESFEIPFFECSCKQNTNIQEAFVTLARKIREQREQRPGKFEDSERLQWEKADLNQNKQSSPAQYRCNC